MPSSLEESFEIAAEKARHIQNVSNDNKLKLYGLFKQVKEGPVAATGHTRPSFFDPTGRAKYDAWQSLGDLPQQQAMKDYIALVESL